MTFLQPWLLAALPIASLPILIHLINQRRYRTTRWAAMMFLLAANRMSRGYARLRQWLILAFRVLVIAALILAISRPLTGGWIGQAAGGRPDTTLLLIDRSPSMQQRGLRADGSKRETGLRRLAQTLSMVGAARWVLIDGAMNTPLPLKSLDDLVTSPAVGPLSASSDLPAMLQAAVAYIKDNKPVRPEIWICSDLRENDWNADEGRWRNVRDALLEFPRPVRIRLLAFPQPAPANLAVRVTDARRRETEDGQELLVSLLLKSEGSSPGRQTIPIQFEIGNARPVVTVELAGPLAELKDHRIPLDPGQQRGWGKVSIPTDSSPADDEYWFVFDSHAPRRTVIVAEEPETIRPLQLAATIAPDPTTKGEVEVIGPDGLATIDWRGVALLLWQAPLPEGDAASKVKAFADRGGQVLFFPPRIPAGAFLGASWTTWAAGPGADAVAGWRGDQDLLAGTQSGAALPVGSLTVTRACGLAGEVTPLATLRGGAPLLARMATDAGGVYFCTTTTDPGDSSMAMGGVVLYVLVQRALAAGAEVLGTTRQLSAGPPSGDDPTRWERLDGAEEEVSTDYSYHRGVYRSGERLLAVNRPAAEDAAPILADDRVAGLFRGLDFSRVDDRPGSDGSLIEEVWKLFLAGMMIAMVVEAALCLPRTVGTGPARRLP